MSQPLPPHALPASRDITSKSRHGVLMEYKAHRRMIGEFIRLVRIARKNRYKISEKAHIYSLEYHIYETKRFRRAIRKSDWKGWRE